MTGLLAFYVLSTTVSAFATPRAEVVRSVLESQPSCGNFVRVDEKRVFLGFGWYRNAIEEPRQPIPAKVRVAPLDGSPAFELATRDAAIDLVMDGDTAYVLTYTSIEEWDIERRQRRAEYPTYVIRGPLAYKQHAQAMSRYGDTLIIAHGRLGFSFFNMRSKRIVNQYRLITRQLPLESMATGVTVQGRLAYVLMDNFNVTRPTDRVDIFRGIVVIDLESGAVRAELGGLDPGADSIVSDSSEVFVSFAGMPIWKFGLASLSGDRLPAPQRRTWRYPIAGHPVGAAAIDDTYYYTCYSKAPEYPRDNGGFYRKIPLALDRRILSVPRTP